MERKAFIDLVDDESLFDRSNSSEDDEYEDEDDEGLRLEVDKDRPFSDQYNSRDDPQVGALLQGSDSVFLTSYLKNQIRIRAFAYKNSVPYNP